jgi:hypothetical protein
MNIDLNLENYNLNEILNLFKMEANFTELDLKNAKKIVLKTHPDKSNLKPDYFIFYSKAYKELYRIWEFKNKRYKNKKDSLNDVIYESINDKEKSKILDNFLSKKDSKDFNIWFNKEFDKNKLEREDEKTGYGEWFGSSEDVDELSTSILSKDKIDEGINKKKEKLRALVVHRGINDIYANTNGSNLSGDVPSSYSSDLFSNLKFEDLKKAHTETVVPVTIEDFNNVKQFNNLNDYNIYRSSQDTTPLSEIQAKEYLQKKQKLDETQTTERAYKLAKELELSNKNQDRLWGTIKLLNSDFEKK